MGPRKALARKAKTAWWRSRPAIAVCCLLGLELAARLFFPKGYLPFGAALPPVPSNENHIPELIRISESPKPKGEFRVLITGGSTAYGIGASAVELSLAPRLEHELRSRYPGRNIRVLNGGVASFDASSELLLYLRFSRRLRPDLVIMFTGFNDLFAAAASQLSPRPHAEVLDLQAIKFVHAGDLSGAAAFFLRAAARTVNGFLIRFSRIFEILEKAVLNLEVLPIKTTAHYRYERAVVHMEGFVDAARAFHAATEARGIGFALALQPMRSCGTGGDKPSSWAGRMVRAVYTRHLRASVRALDEREGVPILDLNGAFVDRLNGAGAFLDICHLSDAGYAASAVRVADFIVERGLVW